MKFEHIVIDPQPAGRLNDVCLIADINNDGLNEIIIGGKQGEGNVVWYQYPDWQRHTIGTAPLEAGGAVADISGNGMLDLIAGDQQGPNLYWFENSGSPDTPWTKRIICSDFWNYHDQAVGDVDNDGEPEVVFASQGKNKGYGVLGYYDIPTDPTVTPWPKTNQHMVCTDLVLEGLAIADIDGDGKNELVAGPNVFKLGGDGRQRTCIDESYFQTRIAVADLNGDGKPEIVMAEGESNPGRLAWVSAHPDYAVNVLADDLFHPHSLALADITGNGLPDIFVAEMGLGRNSNPKIFIFENTGNGSFKRTLVHEGCPTHDAKVGDIGNTGRISIVGKPWNPENHVDLWLNQG
jgi:hypothetical protein